MPAGRPTKYDWEHYRPLLEQAEARGMYMEQLGPHLDLDKTTILEWCEIYPEFSNGVKKVRQACEARVAQMLDNLANGTAEKGNGGVAVFIAKNVLGWRDRQEVISHNTNNNNTTVEVVIGGGAAPMLTDADEQASLPPAP
jgi:hypothetical protein